MNTSRIACVLGTAIAASSLHAQSISEDFESQPAGNFPATGWNDIVERTVGSPAVGPTMTVIETTDAAGNPTLAAQTVQEPGTNGLYREVSGQTDFHHLQMDVRIDSMHSVNAGWPIGVGYSRYSGQDDVNANPHSVIYVWSGRVWNLFVAPGGGRPAADVRIPGPSFTVGKWYTVSLDVDVASGAFEAKIADGETGEILNSLEFTYPQWDSEMDSFTSVTVFDGGNVNSPLQGQATIDNLEYAPEDVNACEADFVQDGMLNFFDISFFLAAFAAQDPVTDFTNDGFWNFFDVSEFLRVFNAGCP